MEENYQDKEQRLQAFLIMFPFTLLALHEWCMERMLKLEGGTGNVIAIWNLVWNVALLLDIGDNKIS